MRGASLLLVGPENKGTDTGPSRVLSGKKTERSQGSSNVQPTGSRNEGRRSGSKTREHSAFKNREVRRKGGLHILRYRLTRYN